MSADSKCIMLSVASLDGEWLLATDPGNVGRAEEWWYEPRPDAKTTRVPGIVQDAFPEYHGIAWYWRDYVAPDNVHEHGRHLLRFHAVDYKSDVWLNGVHVGEHEGGEDPFVLDVTDFVKPNETHRIAVRILNPVDDRRIDGYLLRETPHRVKSGLTNISGILESVEWLATPAVRVEDLYVQPDWRTGAIRIQANVRNALDESDRGGVTFSVAPVASGETLGAAETVYELAPGDTLVEAALAVEDPHLWDIDDPYRYRVTARLSTPNMSSVDESSTCCGFRDFRFEDGYFRLNGRRIYLRCSHTGGCVPIGRRVPQDPDLLRRDLINAKVMGFNSIRFISGMPRPVQLDVCDEIGVMVYEESYAGWYLQDSPWMAERFDRSTTAMIKRDRNHPSVVIWGLLNENFGGEVIRHAAGSLPLIQSLDATRMVMLNSGRHDQQLEIGALANPGSTEWENVLEDRHPYRRVPHTAEIIDYYRTIGGPDLPYFMSEYGVGSAIDLIHAVKHFEQLNASYSEDCQDYMAKRDLFLADWDHWDMAEAFDRPEDFFAQSLGKNAAHRLVGINALRANPNIVGYSLTSTFDPTTSGEGLWTLFRELKPGMVDAIDDGFAPLRWCLFVEPMNVYRHTPAKMEAVLSNEDVLLPGEYPVRIEVFGPNCDRVLERHVTVTIPPSERGSEPPYAMAVFSEDVVIDGPEGEYRLTATFERGGAAVGGEAAFSVVDPVQMPTVEAEVVLWGDDPELVTWLSEHDIRHRPYDPHVERGREVILATDQPPAPGGRQTYKDLAGRIARGSTAVFLMPDVFNKKGDWYEHPDDPLGWLPLANRGRLTTHLNNGIYHPEQWAKSHPIFDGLPCRGLIDYTVYREIIPKRAFSHQNPPDEAIAGAICAAWADYASGLLVSTHGLGAGCFILNTLLIRENLGKDPVAERLLRNMLRYAARDVSRPPVELPNDFDAQLATLGL